MIVLKERPHINDFFKVGEVVYNSTPQYVSVFKDDLERFLNPTNPLFSKFGQGTFFVAYKDGVPVGRIVAHIHHASNTKFKMKRGYFGYFDCIDDLEVSKALLDKTIQYHKIHSMTEVSGNFNLTAMQQIGVLTSGFENHHYTDQVYSAKHMAKLLEAYGFSPSFPMSTFEVDLEQFNPEELKTEKVNSILSDKDYNFLTVKKSNIKKQLLAVNKVLNDGFSENPMFVPLMDEEFLFQAKDMMWIIDEKISSLVEYQGEPVGTVVCIPDLNGFLKNTGSKLSFKTPWEFLKHKLNRNRAVIIFYSVAKKHHGRGVNPAMLYKVTTALKKRGYKSLGITWIADGNPASLAQMKKLSGEKLHGLHLYTLEI